MEHLDRNWERGGEGRRADRMVEAGGRGEAGACDHRLGKPACRGSH